MNATTIILAAGMGKRMNSKIPKQYLALKDKPVLYYSIKAFEESSVNSIVLVVGKDEASYCKKEIVEKYQFKKVTHIVEGGKERYHSVYNGLSIIENGDYVLIHDGARPFVTVEVIEQTLEKMMEYKACAVGMPVKDTIKIVDENNYVVETPDRSLVWMIQTPQGFEFSLIKEAYDKLLEKEEVFVTDDAMVLEKMLGYPVRLIQGSYENIKITTPEDIRVAETLLRE